MLELTPKDCFQLPKLPSVIALACADRVRQNRLCEKLKEIHGVECIERFQLAALSSQSFAALVDSLSNMSLFSKTRLVVVEIPEKKNQLTEKLLAVATLRNISDGTTLIIHFKSQPPTKAVLADLPKDAALIKIELLENEKLVAWLGREVTRLGGAAINAGALKLIAQYAAGDIDAAYQTLEQIVLFADGETITEQTVRSVVTVIPESVEFALLDLLDSGALARAEAFAEALLTQGSSEFLLLSMIARNQLQRVAVRGGLDAKVPDEVLRNSLGITPWLFDRAKKYVLKPNLPSKKQVIAAIVRADSRLKGKSLGSQATLSELFASLLPTTATRGTGAASPNGASSNKQANDNVGPSKFGSALFSDTASDRF